MSNRPTGIDEPGMRDTLTVQDAVQAAVGTATNTAVITRVGSAVSAYGITVTAAPTTVPGAGGSSVITANVKNSAGTAISGLVVNFAQSGGTSVLPVAAITDGNGNAVAIFTGPGGGAGTMAGVVTATISVAGNTYTAAVVITY